MARQVLPIVGAVVGGMFGMPQLGFVIGSLIGNAVDPQVIKGPSIGDGQTQTSKEGVPRPIIYGTACVAGNIIAKGPIRKSIKRTRQGKGGGPVTEEERMHMTWAIRVCEGPVGGILRIWEDEKLVYDIRPGGQVASAENAKYKQRFTAYLGGEDQLPDPALEIIFGAGNTPAYRGTCYIVFDMNDVTDRRGSIPNYRFEVAAEAQIEFYPSLVTKNAYWGGFPGSYVMGQDFSATLDPPYTNIAIATTGSIVISSDNRFIAYHRNAAVDDEDGIYILKWNEETSNFEGHMSLTGTTGPMDRTIGLYGMEFTPDGRFLVATARASGDKFALYSIEIDNGNFNVVDYLNTGFGVGSSFRSIKISNSGNLIACSVDNSRLNGHSICICSISPTGNLSVAVARDPDDVGSSAQPPFYFSWSSGDGMIAAGNGNGVYLYRANDLHRLDAANPGSQGYGSRGVHWRLRGDTGFYAFETSENSKYAYFPVSGGVIGSAVEISLPPSPVEPLETLIATDTEMSIDGRYIAVSTSNGSHAIIYQVPEGGAELGVLQILEASPNRTSAITFSKVAATTFGSASLDTLGHIISDIADRCKVDQAYLDLSQVQNAPVRGFVVAQQYSASNSLRALQNTFFFDPGEWGEQIHFVNRGGAIATTLTLDHLYDDPYTAERKNAFEYPRKLELMYQNATIGYDSAKAEARRDTPSVQVSGTQTLEVPVVMIEDEAAQVADKQLKVAWAEADGELVFSVSYEFDWLTPTDCVGVYLRDTVRRMRIEKIERADGVLKLTGKSDRQSAYTSNVTGIPLPAPTPPPPTIAGPTQFAFLNLPALVDNHDILGYYVAGVGQTPAWYGAEVQESVAGGDFEAVAQIPQGGTMGYLLEAVADASEHYPDTTNTLLVQLYSGEFESVSQEQLLRENNGLALVRSDGTAEIVQFRDAEDLGAGVWRLSYLIRGRLNSGTDSHAVNAKVVLLNGVQLVPTDATMIGVDITHRAVSYGESPEEAAEVVHTFDPVLIQTEFPVDLLELSLDGTNLTAIWSPRERFGTDVNPIRSVNWQNYRVTATDGSATITVDTTSPSAILDVSTLSGNITVTVYQVNRITGAGPGVSATI